MCGDLVQRVAGDFACGTVDIFQVSLGVEIVHGNSRSRHDVVKVVEEQVLPRQLHLVLGIRPSKQGCDRSELLGIQNIFFRAPYSALGLRLRSEDAAMILEVQFAIPRRDLHRRHLFLDVAEKVARKTKFDSGENILRNHHLLRVIEHDPCGTAAVIADAIQVHRLGMISQRLAIDRRRPDRKVVGEMVGIDAFRIVVREVRQKAAAVRRLPPEEFIRESREFVRPLKLLGHEIIHPRLLVNLRKLIAVAE